jgi:hypothetical protein
MMPGARSFWFITGRPVLLCILVRAHTLTLRHSGGATSHLLHHEILGNPGSSKAQPLVTNPRHVCDYLPCRKGQKARGDGPIPLVPRPREGIL